MSTSLDLDVEIFVMEGLDFEPTCESIHHHDRPQRHHGPAAFLQVGPCVHTTGLRCRPVVDHLRATANPFTYWGCDLCGSSWELTEFQFIPLEK